jgi:ribosomal protein L24
MAKQKRPLERWDYVRVEEGQMKGKTGVVCRIDDYTGEVPIGERSTCVVLTNVWEHGIWFNEAELKRVGSGRHLEKHR